ncbi:MAG: rod shape-determining protein MreD [Candidatus Nanopelagicaceae bacterium]
MWRREVLLSTLTFALLFVAQEAFVNQIRLPLGGFSLILVAALIWSSISEPEIAAVTGFIAGFFMDLSPSTDGLFGHWTIVLVVSCFVISYLGYGDDAVNSNPVGLIMMTSSAVIATLAFYIFIGLIFGSTFGTYTNLLKALIGIVLWSALVAPIVVPFISKAHSIVYAGNR